MQKAGEKNACFLSINYPNHFFLNLYCMKTKILHKKMILTVAFLAIVMASKADSTALTFADLQSQFAAASAAGIPSTITLGASITVTSDLDLTSTGDTVTIAVANPLSVTGGILTIGDKVKITSSIANAFAAKSGGNIVVNAGCRVISTATAPLAAAGGNVTINGGSVVTSNFPAATAGSSLGNGGTLTVNGGYLASTNTGTLTRGIVIDYNGICYMNGGEVHADPSVSGRGISINSTNAGGKLYIAGGTISATGTSGRAIQLDNNNSAAWITGSPVIKGGLEAVMAQKNGVVVLAGSPVLTGVIGTNTATSKLYDCRSLSAISASPAAGQYAGNQEITLSGGAGTVNKYVSSTSPTSTVNATLVYTTDGTTPTAASTAYAAPFTLAVPATLHVAPLLESTTVGVASTFVYDIATAVGKVSADDIKINTSFIDVIDLSAIDGFISANLLNLSGQSIQRSEGVKYMNTSSVGKGLYILQITTQKGNVAIKMVKR
jgi:hypothetical protein